MGAWSFVRPEATTNLVTNPSFETATTGYTAVGGSIARSTDKQTKGLYSLKVTPTGANDGVYYGLTLSAATEYTFSVDVWGEDNVNYRVYIYDVTAAAILGSAVAFEADGYWRRYIVTATTGANTSIRVYVEVTDVSTDDFYIDALQVEEKGYATTYCDGDQDGCAWAVGAHSSSSERNAQSSAGGRVIDLDSEGYEFEVRASIGVGHAPIEIIDTLPARGIGGDFQDQVIRPRDFNLVGVIPGEDRSDYHTNRLNLIKVFNPHRLATKQPVQLRYSVAGRSVAIDGYYGEGLEKNQQVGPAVEEVSLSFRAEEPLFRGITGHNNGDRCGGHGALSADVQTNVSNANYIIERDAEGVWKALSTGLNGTVRALAVGPDGKLYVGGSFTTAGGNPANYIAVWDGSSWDTLGTGFDADVMALVFGPDGTLYAGGFFTTADGGAAQYVAQWNGAAWSVVGTTGASNYVYALAMGLDGTLYAGGAFSNVDSVANTLRIAAWDGSNWGALGTGANAEVMALAIGGDGTLYAGGLFTAMGGVSDTVYVAAWDGSAWSALSTGMSGGVVSDLAIGSDGASLYVGGDFDTAGGISASKIAKWNGTKFSALGTGLNGWTYSLLVDGGILYAGGAFTTAGGLTLSDRFAAWNGSSWFAPDIDLPGTATVSALMAMAGSLFVGFNTSGTAVAGAVTGTGEANNGGTANAYPVLRGTGPGRFYQVVNYTTGEGLYFNLDLQDGEEVTLDLRPGKKTFNSSFRGNIINTILEGSDVEEFHLIPGENSISLFIDDATAEAYLEWSEFHWSFDGVVA